MFSGEFLVEKIKKTGMIFFAMKLVIFLGNPGKKYKNTRHNAGFLFADFFQKKHGFLPFSPEKKFFGSIATGNISGKKILLLKPETFMNLSGKSLLVAAQFHKIPTKNILLIFDDKDQKLGSVRFREKGSAGGHNGIKDCIRVLGTDEIARVKIGIDLEEREKYNIPTSDFVLANFTVDQKKILEKESFPQAEEKVLKWISDE